MKNRWTLGLIFSVCVSGCVGKRMEPQAPSEASSPRDKNASDVVEGTDGVIGGQVFQVGQASIQGLVLNERPLESGSRVQIGLEIYFNDKRIRANPELYSVSLTAAQTGADGGISVRQTRSDQDAFDFVITIDGPDVARVRDSYDSIRLFLTVVNRSARSTSTISPSISQVVSDLD